MPSDEKKSLAPFYETKLVSLFAAGHNPPSPAVAWKANDFVAVDDRVRGGSSKSHLTVVERAPEGKGEAEFSGFLDTTTLGGAGFASQLYGHPLPITLSKSKFSGLAISVRQLPITKSELSSDSYPTYPGGGKGPVTSYVLSLKTTIPEKRPDGRRESAIAYEWRIQLPESHSPLNEKSGRSNEVLDFEVAWDDLEPMYRGRPKKDAPKFKPEEVKEWSIMARSDFGKQSGPFALRLVSLSAVSKSSADQSFLSSQDFQSSTLSSALPSSSAPATSVPRSLSASADDDGGPRGSGEYYGFALFIAATVVWALYIAWAALPDEWIQAVGVGWYPNREWAFLIPAWTLVLMLCTYAGYLALNIYDTPDLDNLRTVTDLHANIFQVDPAQNSSSALRNSTRNLNRRHDDDHADDPNSDSPSAHPLSGLHVPQTGGSDGPLAGDIYDLPPGFVSRALYGVH